MRTKSYPTDLTDAQWKRLRPLLPAAKPGGRPRSVDLREVLNGIFYVLRGGGSWRMMPHDLPPWSTCYDYFRKWRNLSVWQQIHDRLRTQVRHHAGKHKSPSAAVLDSQSVKTAAGGPKGFDMAKKVSGRKRHLLVDTLGLLLAVLVTAASVQDRDGGLAVLQQVNLSYPRLTTIWADEAYRAIVPEAPRACLAQLVIVSRTEPGFVVQPKRWIVERTFGWLGGYRRLSKDYERLTSSSESMIHASMSHLMLNRLCRA
jgi:putative transposase